MNRQEQKANIEAMLRAEGLKPGSNSEEARLWNRFKEQMNADLLAAETPPLVLRRPARRLFVAARWLLPLCACALIGVVLYQWLPREFASNNGQQTSKISPATKTTTPLKSGDVYRRGKRLIALNGGTAAITELADGSTIVATSQLNAKFDIREKVNLQIRHPLLSVTITGTQFTFEANRDGGKIILKEGSVRIDYAGKGSQPNVIVLQAPTTFTFSSSGYVKSTAPLPLVKVERPLFRYDLTNGETFYAYQESKTPQVHSVKLLGGDKRRLPTSEILRVVSADQE